MIEYDQLDDARRRLFEKIRRILPSVQLRGDGEGGANVPSQIHVSATLTSDDFCGLLDESERDILNVIDGEVTDKSDNSRTYTGSFEGYDVELVIAC